jgi:hypothetical protein
MDGIVDMGCGGGGLLRAFADILGHHKRYHGYDKDGPVLDCTRAMVETRGNDLVIMCHSIEHMDKSDLARAMHAARVCTWYSGRLVIITPNCEGLGASLFGRRWRGWNEERHVAWYTPGSLRMLMTMQGFDVLHIETRQVYWSSLWRGLWWLDLLTWLMPAWMFWRRGDEMMVVARVHGGGK